MRYKIAFTFILLASLLAVLLGLLVPGEVAHASGVSWSLTGALNVARAGHTATLLPNGKVLIAGGFGNNALLASAELYDPGSGNWLLTGSMNVARWFHTATLLPNGQVLVAGGQNSNALLSSVELYDPGSGRWSLTGSMNVARWLHTATLLPNGKVLVARGDGSSDFPTASAELYSLASVPNKELGGELLPGS